MNIKPLEFGDLTSLMFALPAFYEASHLPVSWQHVRLWIKKSVMYFSLPMAFDCWVVLACPVPPDMTVDDVCDPELLGDVIRGGPAFAEVEVAGHA